MTEVNEQTQADGTNPAEQDTNRQVLIGDTGVEPTDHESSSPGSPALPDPDEQVPIRSVFRAIPVNQEEIPRNSEQSDQGGQLTRGDMFSRVTLGSALLAMDNVSERLKQAQLTDQSSEAPGRSLESVLVPVSDWEEQFGVSPDLAARYLALGMMVGAREKANRASHLVVRVSNLLAKGVNSLLKPFVKNKAFSPVNKQFTRMVEVGEGQVKQWMATGRVEDARNKALAQSAVNRIADEALDDVVENQRVQEFIQEIVSAQSMGILDEAIEEIRERTLSTDIFIERPFRRLLRRPRRENVPAPPYNPEIVRPVKRHHLVVSESSLLGYYAGFMSRLFAFALDIAFLAAFIAIGGWLITTTVNLFGLEDVFSSFKEATTFVESAGTIIVSLSGLIVVVGYFLLFWVLTGQTLGMMILGLRVVNRHGRLLSLGQGISRVIGFLLSAALLFLGFAWILIDDKREGWQDKIARSYVVYAWDANPDESFLYDYISREY